MRTRKVGLFDLDASLAPEKPENLTAAEFELARQIACQALFDQALLGGRSIGTAVAIVGKVACAPQAVQQAAIRWAANIVTLLVGEAALPAARAIPTAADAKHVRLALEDEGADPLLIIRARSAEAALELYEAACSVRDSVNLFGGDLLAKARDVAVLRWKELTSALPVVSVERFASQAVAQNRPPSAPTLTPLCAEISPPYAPTPLCAENQGGDAPTWQKMTVRADEVMVGDEVDISDSAAHLSRWRTVVGTEFFAGAGRLWHCCGSLLLAADKMVVIRRRVTPLCADQRVSS